LSGCIRHITKRCTKASGDTCALPFSDAAAAAAVLLTAAPALVGGPDDEDDEDDNEEAEAKEVEAWHMCMKPRSLRGRSLSSR